MLVSCNTFRHPPLLAKEAVTVDHISGGRLEFGLGAGWFVPEHEMFGIPFPATAELVGRFREAVEICHQLFTQDITTYDGQYYQIRDAPFRPAPLQQPRMPFTLGAHGPRMMRIVARYADRWNSNGSVAEMASATSCWTRPAPGGRTLTRSSAPTSMCPPLCQKSAPGTPQKRCATSWAACVR